MQFYLKCLSLILFYSSLFDLHRLKVDRRVKSAVFFVFQLF
ncbi:hypothetical protein HMPREF9087_0052 [Enterococcus casseliflavus ATCC 12755]|uniref:Uncharacterized protein n=1 Tax=Enterococcus casseliflavus ATCC 12755 TaxID=888066 RepID=F0EF34_ENTCA|nr:hypothetical protein HMPREF9087_0052 [Enterococcus casseliflavus ATCC 12755]EPH68146.1 hypothetical protein D931_00138 [Enterococcus faecium 13.SD.W.09]EPH95927.1 hypothetical protein D922_01037 [Enterococcus faecalis 06-MB-DW-09]